jgi:Holliday junction resolvase
MSHPSKQKGNRFEREIVEKAIDRGLKDAKRAWGSNGMALGEHPEVDCLIKGYKIQAKVRKKLPKYLIPSNEVDAVVFKQDRGEILMLIRYEDWLFEKAREKDE